MDGYGGVHWCVEDITGNIIDAPWANNQAEPNRVSQPYFGWDIARAMELFPNGCGYMLLDGFGNIHVVGNPKFQFPTDQGQLSFNFGGQTLDIAVDFTTLANPRGEIEGMYILDKFGVIHSLGNTIEITGPNFLYPKAIALDAVPYVLGDCKSD